MVAINAAVEQAAQAEDGAIMSAEKPIFDRGSRHKWREPVTLTDETATGCEETHRTCVVCGMVKITVHPPQGLPWREWIAPSGMRATLTATPPCIAVAKDAAA